jgi:hypothetical protein
MKKLKIHLAAGLFVLSLLLIACEKQGKDPDGDPSTNKPDIPETSPAIQKAVNFNVNANIGGYMEALPARYDSTNKKYPLLVFLHGLGELGNGTTQLANVTIKWRSGPAEKQKIPAGFYG